MSSKAWFEWDCCHQINILHYILRYIIFCAKICKKWVSRVFLQIILITFSCPIFTWKRHDFLTKIHQIGSHVFHALPKIYILLKLYCYKNYRIFSYIFSELIFWHKKSFQIKGFCLAKMPFSRLRHPVFIRNRWRKIESKVLNY